jgi:putative Ca2+/H+ antiporter (TMEM165/GDT1 family)
MDVKTFFVTFGLVFLAELGDKTQLATMALAAKSDAPMAVFLAASSALVASALLGTLFGEALTRLVPSATLHLAAGIAFLVLGGLLVGGRL